MKPADCNPGTAVFYQPRVGPDRPKYRGLISTNAWQLGGGTWVVHLDNMEPDYGVATGRPGRTTVAAAAVDHLELAPVVASSPAPAGFSRVKIVSPDPAGHRAKVTVDGVEAEALTRVDLKLEVNAITTVVLHHVGPEVDFEGLAKVVHAPPTLEERVRAALDRVRNGSAAMRIPADPTDPDLVLADVLRVLELAREVRRA